MLKLSFAVFLFCSFSTASHGQDSTASKKAKSTDSTVSSLSGKMDIIIQSLKKGSDTDIEPIGIMHYDTLKQIRVYTANEIPTARTIVINKVTMLLQDGYIIDIQIFAGDEVFTNTRAPITVDGKTFSDPRTDYLYSKSNSDEMIILQEAISYDPLTTFFPEDRFLLLTNKFNSDTLKRNVGVNTVLDLRVYTDALAALGNEPNGIFQTDVHLKQFLHRKHYRNEGSRILQYIKINFNASKLDSKNSFVDSSSQISRSELYQKSTINLEGAVNILNSWLGRKTLNNYYFDFGGGINTVRLAGLHDTSAIAVPSLFFEGGISIRNSSNIGFDFNTRYTFQYSPQTAYNHQDGDVKFLRIGAEVYWNPFGDAANRVFGRINYVMGLSTIEKKNSYSQIQIGYSTLLSKVIGK